MRKKVYLSLLSVPLPKAREMEIVMGYLRFYSHEKITDRIYIITEGYSMIHRMTLGLIVGDEKILLIDSGMAMTNDLRQYIEMLAGTQKPIICVCTHLHPDHVSGAVLFEHAYCSHYDYPAGVAFAFSKAERLGDLEELSLHNSEVMEYCRKHMTYPTERDFEDIRDGDRFDLGGVVIEAIALPGHTPGSMAFLDRMEGHVFPGDGINMDVHLSQIGKEGYARYKKTLEHFLDVTGENVILHPAHQPLAVDASIVKKLIQACDDIIRGNVTDDPPGDTMFSYRNLRKANTTRMFIHYVNNTGITYDSFLTDNVPHSGVYQYYSHEKISERVYIVTENYSVVHHFTIGVITGDKITFVVNAGLGMTDNLRQYIEEFAGKDKPIWCVCTSGAAEQTGGAGAFDRAYVNMADQQMLDGSCNSMNRRPLLDDYALYEPRTQEYAREHMQEVKAGVFRDASKIESLDLGGIVIEKIPLPGVTPGSEMYYLREEDILFSGDAVNRYVHLDRLTPRGIGFYAEKLDHVLKITGQSTRIFAFHSNVQQNRKLIENLIQACHEVADGRTYGDPPAETIVNRGNNNRMIRMHYYKNCCIVYRKLLRVL